MAQEGRKRNGSSSVDVANYLQRRSRKDSPGNHSFIVRMIDKGQPGTNDAFGLKLINSSDQIVNSFTFNPVVLGGGNNQVPKK